MISARIMISKWTCALLSAVSLSAQCFVINVYDTEAYSKGNSISVGMFEMEGGRINYKAGPLEALRRVLLESLKEDLTKTKYFASVEAVAADQEAKGHYYLEGGILGVHGGSRSGRLIMGGVSNAGQMRVNGRLYGPVKKGSDGKDVRPVVSDFECISFDMGGWTGMGGNETAAKKNADKIANSLSKQVFGKLDKRLDKLAEQVQKDDKKDDEKDAITGESKQSERKWRQKEEWKANDYEDEIETFVIRSDRKRSRGADSLWLTQASYGAHQKLLPMLPPTALLRSGEIERGMLTELEPLAQFVGKDLYVLAVTFNVTADDAPFLWDRSKFLKTTTLSRVDDPASRVSPQVLLDDAIRSYIVFRQNKVLRGKVSFWAFHPILIAFPSKKADGTPFLRGVDDKVELRTEIDGRAVRLEYDLKHLDIKSLDDLKIAPAKTAGN